MRMKLAATQANVAAGRELGGRLVLIVRAAAG